MLLLIALRAPVALTMALAGFVGFASASFALRICTVVGCDEGAEIVLKSKGGFAAGDYNLYLKTENNSYSCSIQNHPKEKAFCYDFNKGMAADFYLDNDILKARVYVDDPRLRPINNLPNKLSLSISRNGSLIFQEAYQPNYNISYPNGEDCNVCFYWNAEVMLD